MISNLTPAQATLLAAAIAAIASLLVCIMNNRAQAKKFIEELQKQAAEKATTEAVRDARVEMWMQSVDKKLDEHNGYAKRFSEIGEDIAVIKNDIKTLYKQRED